LKNKNPVCLKSAFFFDEVARSVHVLNTSLLLTVEWWFETLVIADEKLLVFENGFVFSI
jgi:hypothetical protein